MNCTATGSSQETAADGEPCLVARLVQRIADLERRLFESELGDAPAESDWWQGLVSNVWQTLAPPAASKAAEELTDLTAALDAALLSRKAALQHPRATLQAFRGEQLEVRKARAQAAQYEEQLACLGVLGAQNDELRRELSEARLAAEGLRAARNESDASSASAAAALSERERREREARSALGETARELAELQGQLSATQAERDRALECVAEMRTKVNEVPELQRQAEAMRGEVAAARAEAAAFKGRFLAEREQRRALHEHIQTLRGNIRVVCRVRPAAGCDAEDGATACAVRVHDEEPGVLTLVDAPRERQTQFEFNDVAGPACTQEDVWQMVAPMVRSCVDGYNATIFAYGQTGSGKTYTMSGTDGAPGVHARAVENLFEALADAGDGAVVEVSMLEIYCDALRDLLADPSDSPQALDVSGLGPGQLASFQERVPGLAWRRVADAAEAMAALAQGRTARTVHATRLNAASSRSHELISLRLYTPPPGAAAPAPADFVRPAAATGAAPGTCRRLHLVDLAGSERVGRSGVVGQQLAEAQSINRSLSALGDVVAALQAGSLHVPYRNSKLTAVLQDALCGSGKVLLVCNVAPEAAEARETLSSLTFAQRAAQVEMGAAQKAARKRRKSASGGTPPLRLSSGRIAPAPGRKRQPLSGKENATGRASPLRA